MNGYSSHRHNITVFALTFLLIFTMLTVYRIDKRIETVENRVDTIVTMPTQAPTSPVEPSAAPKPNTDLSVPKGITGAFKSYMDYESINDRDSKQYHLQKLCSTDAQGLRKFNGYYLVAMGTGYVKYIGQPFIITLSTGKIIKVMAGDYKADKDTDSTHRYCAHNSSIIEFIVEEGKLSPAVVGDISVLGFEGAITRIQKG